MRTANWLLGMLVASALAVGGCGKSDSTGDRGLPPALDLPKFLQAFPSPTPGQQSNIDRASQGIRYGLYPQALTALDKLAADPALTEAQKNAVSNLVAGIKHTMAKTPTPPAQ